VVLSKRERYIFIATVAVVSALALNYVFIGPLLTRKNELDAKITDYKRQEFNAQRLIDTRDRMRSQWAAMTAGPLKKDASQAESQFFQSSVEWQKEAGISRTPPSIDKPDRSEKEKDFFKMPFRASGTFTMSQLGHFLYAIQNASIPVRVTDITVTSRPEGSDELSVQLGIATVYLSPDIDKPAAKPPGPAVNREATP
jgi:hypothetical protein